jgi:1-phosphofructokinase family hexose kinase
VAVVVINPNPVFDRTILLERLVAGTVMRTVDVEVTAGGKGINVARVLRAFDVDANLIVPVGAEDHQRYQHLLEAEGATFEVFDVSGYVRIASIYREQDSEQVTVVNDAGYSLPEPEWDAFVSFCGQRVKPGDVALVMGSLPAGLPKDSAARLVAELRACGAAVLVDTAPTWLAPALAAAPNAIAPNVHEALAALSSGSSFVFDDTSLSDAEAREWAEESAMRAATATGGLACVTAGSAGVAFAEGGRVEWIDAPEVSVVSAVGAGDSFVAGLAMSWHEDLQAGREIDWRSAVGFGVACAATSCEGVRAGGVDPVRVRQLATTLNIEAPGGVRA